MKRSSFLHFAAFGVQTILFKKKKPILGTVIVTDKCNLHCKHCSVNNITAIVHPYLQIRQEMHRCSFLTTSNSGYNNVAFIKMHLPLL